MKHQTRIFPPRTTVLAALLVLFATTTVYGIEDVLEEIDELHEYDQHGEIFELIERHSSSSLTDEEQAQLEWRRSRSLLSDTDLRHRNGELSDREARDLLEEGEEAGRQALELDDDIAEAHFWTGSNIGLEGQIRGVLRALTSAGSVRDFAVDAIALDSELKEAYYLLGILHRELPGGLISFGNDAYAVSLGRKAVDLHDSEYEAGSVPFRYFDFYLDLAESLWERNWSERRRNNRRSSIASDHSSADGAFERATYYEGTIDMPNTSDREEAQDIVRQTREWLQEMSEMNTRQRLALERAEELLEDW